MANSRTNGTSGSLRVSDRSKNGGARAILQRNAKTQQPARRQESNNSYLTGYARPPKHAQFRPGQSGNPAGHRKKRESLQDIVANVLFEKMEVQIGERTAKIPGVAGLIRTAMTRALQGDYKFLMAVIAFIRLSGLSDVGSDALMPETNARSDEAVLADFIKRHGFSQKSSGEAQSKPANFKRGEVHDDDN
jgi:Family of unknown function (DUF5681)